jgi:hypothetical protein
MCCPPASTAERPTDFRAEEGLALFIDFVGGTRRNRTDGLSNAIGMALRSRGIPMFFV